MTGKLRCRVFGAAFDCPADQRMLGEDLGLVRNFASDGLLRAVNDGREEMPRSD